MHPRHAPFLLPFFFLLTIASFAQSQQTTACKLAVSVSVLQEGTLAPVPDLAKSSFSLTTGKTRISPDSAEPAKAKRVVILLDISGSMRQPWPTVDRIVRELLSDIPSNIDVVGYSFGEKVSKIGARDAIVRFLADAANETQIRVKGRTRFFNSLNEIAAIENTDSDSVIAVISDGANNEGGLDQRKTQQEFTRRETRLMLVIVRSDDFPTVAEEQSELYELPSLMNKTGGMGVVITWGTRIPVPSRVLPPKVADTLLNFYRLEFDDPTLADKNIHFDVVGADAKKLKKVEVHSVPRMPACR